MMRMTAVVFAVISGLLLVTNPADANSFHKDVVAGSSNRHSQQRRLPFVNDISSLSHHDEGIEEKLLSKAIPIEEYNRQLKSLGIKDSTTVSAATVSRALEDAEGDDYYMNENEMYSFSGYSLKYAKCQPVQRFSEEAILSGEYSPMVTEDVVILRLCPYKSCSSSRQYGCHYNYAEYAIGLNDYIRIMLRHKADKKEKLCEFCAGCAGRRKLEEGDNNQNNNQDGGNNNNNNNGQRNDDYYNADDDGNKNNNNNNNYYNNYNYNNQYDEQDECYTYSSYCENYYYDCEAGENNYDDNNQNNYYIAEDEYYDYLACSEIKDNNGNIYFVRPSCDQTEDIISMAVFYDEYCSQYAGDVVSKNDFQVAFDDSIFEEFYDGACVDCSESVSE